MGGLLPDYSNLIQTVNVTVGTIKFKQDCYIVGTLRAGSSEPAYITYTPAGKEAMEIFNTGSVNTTISIAFYARKDDSIYIRLGSTANLKIFGLQNQQ